MIAVLGAVANKLKACAGKQRKETVESNARYEWNEKAHRLLPKNSWPGDFLVQERPSAVINVDASSRGTFT